MQLLSLDENSSSVHVSLDMLQSITFSGII